MAAATVTSTSYGYRVTGDTGATTVSSSKIRVKSFVFVNPSDANSKTCTMTDAAGNSIIIIKNSNVNGDFSQVWWDEAPIDGLIVTINSATAILLINVA